ncbi:hypothetical protein HanIR_Chr09g0416071 [Helianthus annuus]|nr:hypothetical protein HanIR_Chr09g0416071 [Helianthus annuus]
MFWIKRLSLGFLSIIIYLDWSMLRARMKIKRQARTEHMFNKASATLMCRYSKRRIKSRYVYRLNYKSF